MPADKAIMPVAKEAIAQIFTEARSHHAWLDKPVSDDVLKELYETLKWGPTSMNASPARFLFIKSAAEKARLVPTLMGSNVGQVEQAPVTVVIAQDSRFYDQLPKLFPVFDARPMFTSNAALTEVTAFRNSTLQGAYLLMAARALGLDAGPMSGFNNALIDETFFAGTTWKSNFIATLGYGDHAKLHPRGPRLSFDEAAKIV